MKSALFTEAKAEIVAQVSKELVEHLLPIAQDVVMISINRAAGFLDISPDTAKRLFKGRTIKLSARQLRVSLADVLAAAETYRKGKPTKKGTPKP